jgi:Ca2+-binding RTX toxin-like protein
LTVNLKTNTATGTGGVFNVRNVTGGFITNIIVGDGNNNVLKGGEGRSIIISGGGNSTLQAGSGETILIGGHYLFDTDSNALAHLMAEWSRTDLGTATDPTGYQARVQHLENGGGLNDPFLLNASTVVADAGTQTLTTGFGLDFLIVDAADVLTNPLRKGEQKLVV